MDEFVEFGWLSSLFWWRRQKPKGFQPIQAKKTNTTAQVFSCVMLSTESQDLQRVPFLPHSTFALRGVVLSVTIRSWLGCLPQKKPEDTTDDHFDWEEELKHLGEEIVADSSDSHAAPAADKNPGSAADTSEKAGGADAGKGSA